MDSGVAAAELAKAGKSVLVIDKGKYYHEDDFDLRESAGFANLYEYGGFFSTYEGSVNVLAGSVFGGGTTVNWSASLKVCFVWQACMQIAIAHNRSCS